MFLSVSNHLYMITHLLAIDGIPVFDSAKKQSLTTYFLSEQSIARVSLFLSSDATNIGPTTTDS